MEEKEASAYFAGMRENEILAWARERGYTVLDAQNWGRTSIHTNRLLTGDELEFFSTASARLWYIQKFS